MTHPKFILLVVLILVISSCFRNLYSGTDMIYEDIVNASIRLFHKHEKDTLIKSSYEEYHNLPGNLHVNLESCSSIDSVKSLGVAIRFWTKFILSKGEYFYGPYPKNGLLNKIDRIEIDLSNNSNKLDITKWLHGDSTLSSFLWRNDYLKEKSLTSYAQNGGTKGIYFKKVEDWIETLNNYPELLEGISMYDFLFLIDKSKLEQINFTPEYLKLKIHLSDSTNTVNKILSDSIKLKTF